MKAAFVFCISAVLCTSIYAMRLETIQHEVTRQDESPVPDAAFQFIYSVTCDYATMIVVDQQDAYNGGTLEMTHQAEGRDDTLTTEIFPKNFPRAFFFSIGPYKPCETIITAMVIRDANGDNPKYVNGTFATDCPCDDGSVAHDPHYHSFDGRKLEYQGPCGYVLSKDGCQGGVTKFEICAINNGPEDQPQHTRHISGVHIKSYGNIIDVARHVTVLNDKDIDREVPTVSDDSTIMMFKHRDNTYIVYNVVHHWWVECSHDRIDVFLHQDSKLRGNVCGMFGNADGDPANDDVCPDGTKNPDPIAFGDAWECPNSCEIKTYYEEDSEKRLNIP